MVSDLEHETSEMALLGLKPPGHLNLNENLAANWRSWLSSYEIYATAAGIASKSEKVQTCVFLHMASPEAQKVYRNMNLPKLDLDKLVPLIDAFRTYYEGKSNRTVTRYKFNSYNQGDESMDTYIRELKSLIPHCEYGQTKQSILCDRLVCGVGSDKLRDRLLQTVDLMLQQSEDMCRMSEHRSTGLYRLWPVRLSS